MAKRNQQFQTIRSQGAILPSDLLRRVAAREISEGISPESYHLTANMKISDEISQSWAKIKSHWDSFSEVREQIGANDDTGSVMTRDRWLLPLFQELGYGRLTTVKAPEIDDRTYPITRFWNHVPIHLIGYKLSLDRRTKGAIGAATAIPHSMVQEFLNRSDDHLWAFLSNGLQLRILRDNLTLSRQAFVEFDLEAMMEGEVYADFALLWMLCHESRVEADNPEECWLEKWSKLAHEQGTRILADLRVGVTEAIEALGRGFVGHRANETLRARLRKGDLSGQDLYRQILRLVYRFLFLFVAEDRGLLHPPQSDLDASERYDGYYSTRRLRDLAERVRGTGHADLWHVVSNIFVYLNQDEGCESLALPALGSFLWSPSSTPDLNGPGSDADTPVLISNHDLLDAVRALAFVEQDRVLRSVDYRNLGSEELGSVYESLLELHPEINAEAKTFVLSRSAGHERKTTGSYYTPDSLVQCLLDSALEPVVEDRLGDKKGEDAETALLNMKICDPACGSGHFLIAAAHRMARHLARVRTGESEPGPDDYQHALRDVIGRCIYGVDLNPMAAELCRVALWIESLEPGRPLSFLDHHIKVGNSLLGTTPELMEKGIPDDAFKALTGDDKKVCSELKRVNKKERKDYEKGQMFLTPATTGLGDLPEKFAALSSAPSDSIDEVKAKADTYQSLVASAEYERVRFLADMWCAAFVIQRDEKNRKANVYITERVFREAEASPDSVPAALSTEVQRLRDEYSFFHWHLEFPEVFGWHEHPPVEGHLFAGHES